LLKGLADSMKSTKYILGVDGGNTKTDYLLCCEDGEFVDILRCPTCSHEHRGVGFDGMQNIMESHLNELFSRHEITVKNISSAAFGLAGADFPDQICNLTARIENLGFKHFKVSNDGLLGVKAISDSGVCAINGSGTVIFGVDDEGKLLQVGGIGNLSGDYAGGAHIMRTGVGRVYDYFYRLGKETTITEKVFNALDIKEPNELVTRLSDGNLLMSTMTDIITIIDSAAQQGDEVSQKILDDVGTNVAEGVCGCIRNLNFTSDITIVMAGNIWKRLNYVGLTQNFKSTIRSNIKTNCNFTLLNAPPALGALFWAKELLGAGKNEMHHYRKRMLDFLTIEKYDSLVTTQNTQLPVF